MEERKSTKECHLPIQESARPKSTVLAKVRRSFDSDRRSIHSFEASTTEFEPEPSRNKLEMLKSARETLHQPSTIIMPNSIFGRDSRVDNTLLDSYEVEWILRQLTCYVESSRTKSHRCGSDSRKPEVVNDRVFLKKDFAKTSWLRRGIVCGSSRNDVVESKSSDHQRLDKRKQHKE